MARKARRGGAVALGVGLLTLACWNPAARDAGSRRSDEPGESRRTALRRQIEVGRELGPAWQRWFDALAAVDRRGAAEGPFLVRRHSELPLYDDLLRRRLTDPRSLADPEGVGPLATVVGFAEELRPRGIDLLVIPVPTRATIYPEEIPSGVAPPRAGDDTPLDWRVRELYLALEERGVEVLDLVPVFRAQPYRSFPDPHAPAGQTIQPVFQRQDTHWTSYGAYLAAEAVGKRVRRYPWFAETSHRFGRAVVRTERTWTSRVGPVARSLVRGGLAPADLRPERLLRISTRAVGERWSFADPSAPVLLLGDSFSRHGYGFPGALLRELGYRVDMIVVTGGLPAAQLKALRLRDDPLAGKRLVLWEISVPSLRRWDEWEPTPIFAGSGDRPRDRDRSGVGVEGPGGRRGRGEGG